MTTQKMEPEFQQDMKQFMNYMEEEKNASNSTVLSYQRDLKKLFLYLDERGIHSVDEITSTNLNSYVLQMEKQGFSTSSVSRSVASMRAFFHYLFRMRKTEDDPSEKVRSPHVNKKIPEILTMDEAILLLEQPDTSTDKGIVTRPAGASLCNGYESIRASGTEAGGCAFINELSDMQRAQ